MNKRSFFLFVLISLTICTIASAQEILVGASHQNEIKKHALIKHYSKALNVDTLVLPFIDDFSDSKVFPNNAYWQDDFVYINNSFPLNQPSFGVATFDVLDNNGELYEDASSNAFIADSLTSHCVRLDSIFEPFPKKLTPNDNVYLSFLYQPGGLGNLPELKDSLVLQFYKGIKVLADTTWKDSILYDVSQNPIDTLQIIDSIAISYIHDWQTMWRVQGMADDTTTNFDSTFRFVSLKINDTAYFKKFFKFRFYNKASVDKDLPSWAMNTDFWHIDYVYLDYDRSSQSVFTYPDLTYLNASNSCLADFQAIPYLQFKSDISGFLDESIYARYANQNNTPTSANTQCLILYGDDTLYRPQKTSNLYPFNTSGASVNLYPKTGYNSVFNIIAEDSIALDVYFLLEKDDNTVDAIKSNNTLHFRQVFANYYAYDDGSAEAGYGLTPAGSIMAYKFNAPITDTLQAVDICFNHTADDENLRFFDLIVWQDELTDANIIYQQKSLKKDFDNGFNNYYRYFLLPEHFVDADNRTVTDDFYIGLKQKSDEMLNIGYDLNNDAGNKTFYNVDGTWQESLFHGALMIRPFLGKTLPNTPSSEKTNNTDKQNVKVFPNPTKLDNVRIELNQLFFGIGNTEDLKVKIYSTAGNLVYEQTFGDYLNISGFGNGVYIVSVENAKNGAKAQTKLIVIK